MFEKKSKISYWLIEFPSHWSSDKMCICLKESVSLREESTAIKIFVITKFSLAKFKNHLTRCYNVRDDNRRASFIYIVYSRCVEKVSVMSCSAAARLTIFTFARHLLLEIYSSSGRWCRWCNNRLDFLRNGKERSDCQVPNTVVIIILLRSFRRLIMLKLRTCQWLDAKNETRRSYETSHAKIHRMFVLKALPADTNQSKTDVTCMIKDRFF